MNKYLVSIIALAVSVAFVSSASAGTRDPRINARQHHEHERIGQGVKSGELTRSEAKDLRGDQRNIRQEERAYKSDGKFTKDERQDVRQDESAASKEIYQEKHDEEVRTPK